jgi:hypothetical protein
MPVAKRRAVGVEGSGHVEVAASISQEGRVVLAPSTRFAQQRHFSLSIPNMHLMEENRFVRPGGGLEYEGVRRDRGQRWDALLSFLADIGSSLVRADHLMERYVVWCDRRYTQPPWMTEKQIAEDAMDILNLLDHRSNEESVAEVLMFRAATLW